MPGAIDIVGTGGDHSGSYNVSTLAAIITAACGVPVAKHGNRAATSRSGAADVLAALGVKLGLDPDGLARCLARGRPVLHVRADPSRAPCATSRRCAPSCRTRTIFNLLGPLSNPAGVERQLFGVSSATGPSR